MELWDNVLSCIEKKVSHQNFDIWFKPTSLQDRDLEKKELRIRVPNQHFKYWLSENYSEIIQTSLSELELDQFQLSFGEVTWYPRPRTRSL